MLVNRLILRVGSFSAAARQRLLPIHEYGRLSGTGFLLIGGMKYGPIIYDIAIIGQGRFTFGQGWIDGSPVLLLAACRSQKIALVLRDRTEIEATFTRRDGRCGWVELPEVSLTTYLAPRVDRLSPPR